MAEVTKDAFISMLKEEIIKNSQIKATFGSRWNRQIDAIAIVAMPHITDTESAKLVAKNIGKVIRVSVASGGTTWAGSQFNRNQITAIHANTINEVLGNPEKLFAKE